MAASTVPTPTLRADDLHTTLDVVRALARRRALAAVTVAALGLAGVRVGLGGWSVADAGVALVLVALAGPIEWTVHRHLFHAPPRSRRTRRLGTGVGHRHHHADPADLRWLLLGADGVVAFALVFGLIATVAAIGLSVVLGVAAVGPVMTGVAVAWSALARYEAVHLAHHSRRRPWTARGRRIRAHHLAHHHRLPGAKLGVTTTMPDRLFGTDGA